MDSAPMGEMGEMGRWGSKPRPGDSCKYFCYQFLVFID
jgi:hypothetical protein